MRARRGHQAGVGRRGGTSVRRSAAAIAVVAAAALSLTAGAVPASAAVVYTVTNTIPVGSPPSGLAVDPVTGTVYVSRAGEVSVIDAATDTVTATIPVGGGGGAGAIVADPAAGTVYVAGGNGVLVIDAATNKVTANIPLSGGAGAMSVDPAAGTIYAVTGEEGPRGPVSVIDMATNTVTATISVSANPLGVSVDPALGTVYVVSSDDPQSEGPVSVIDAATNTVTATIRVGLNPQAVAVDPAAGTVYVLGGPVSVIDAATNTVTATISLENGPDAVAVDPAAGTVYVANTNYNERTGSSNGGTVSVIDAASNAVTATVPVGINPTAVAVDPVTHAVYVANAGSGTVSVISSTQAAQAIAFTSAPPAKPVTGGTYRVAATGGGSGNPVTFTIGAWSTSVCSISGKVVTFKAGGYCVINANQAGDAGYAPAQPAQQTVTVAAAVPKLSWAAPAPVTYGTAVTGTQLDPTSSVPGAFSYSPPAGTVLKAGTQTLTAIFIPVDWTAYAGGMVSVKLTVRPAPLTAKVAGSQTYGGSPAFTVSGYSGLVNGDTATAVGGRLAGCATTLGSGAAPGTYPGTISGCSGLSATDYAISYHDAGVTVSRAALKVTASGGSMTYGGAPPAITASYTGFAHGDSAASLTTRPSCSTTATSASPVGRYPSRCSGAADPDYAISYASGTVTVAQAGTALAYGGRRKVSAGAGLVPAAVLTSPAGACEDAQPVTFTLNANPKTGAAGAYPLESATTSADGAATGATVSTSGWQAGAYAITASYAGTSDCAPSTTIAPLAVTTRARPRVLGRMG